MTVNIRILVFIKIMALEAYSNFSNGTVNSKYYSSQYYSNYLYNSCNAVQNCFLTPTNVLIFIVIYLFLLLFNTTIQSSKYIMVRMKLKQNMFTIILRNTCIYMAYVCLHTTYLFGQLLQLFYL